MVQAHPQEFVPPNTRSRVATALRAHVFVLYTAFAACALSCTSSQPATPALQAGAGQSRQIETEWDGLGDRLEETLSGLDLWVSDVTHPAPDWIVTHLLDGRSRPVTLRLHRLGPVGERVSRVEARCVAGRFGDEAIERAVLDALALSIVND